MPASPSCVSSLSTGVPRTLASCLIVTSDIDFVLRGPATRAVVILPAALRTSAIVLCLEGDALRCATPVPRRPLRDRVLARSHDQRRRLVFVDTFDAQLHELVGGEVGEVLARDDAMRGEF